jgi:hypothetical protein
MDIQTVLAAAARINNSGRVELHAEPSRARRLVGAARARPRDSRPDQRRVGVRLLAGLPGQRSYLSWVLSA